MTAPEILLLALAATISVSTRGYRALTNEELAAVVEIRPTGAQRFTAFFQRPDSSQHEFALAGAQLYVDARP